MSSSGQGWVFAAAPKKLFAKVIRDLPEKDGWKCWVSGYAGYPDIVSWNVSKGDESVTVYNDTIDGEGTFVVIVSGPNWIERQWRGLKRLLHLPEP